MEYLCVAVSPCRPKIRFLKFSTLILADNKISTFSLVLLILIYSFQPVVWSIGDCSIVNL